jgi:AhpD family alkylhydroperoxidase
MSQRLSITETAPEVYEGLLAADQAVRGGPLGATVRELVKIRASQLNGCAYCVDLHVREALKLGESQDRLFQLPVWRESPLFTGAERAALGYTDAATLLGPDGVSDEVWREAASQFKPDELGALVGQVALINAFNRIGVPLQMQPRIRTPRK